MSFKAYLVYTRQGREVTYTHSKDEILLNFQIDSQVFVFVTK